MDKGDFVCMCFDLNESKLCQCSLLAQHKVQSFPPPWISSTHLPFYVLTTLTVEKSLYLPRGGKIGFTRRKKSICWREQVKKASSFFFLIFSLNNTLLWILFSSLPNLLHLYNIFLSYIYSFISLFIAEKKPSFCYNFN